MESAEEVGPKEVELKRLETGKWRPSSIGGCDALLSLFAEGFVSVEYGADLHGAVERKFDASSILASPGGAKLVEMLDATVFALEEWHFIHPVPNVVIVSYRVTAAAFGWTAYATSVWSWHDGSWQTVFYQASQATPAT